ncbi:Maf family protein [Ruminococcaceae bacterium OttesenSCG-928-L11]|nr:Maf family protein [Ruminococcaceae bacterium OttesenSCG-928-L11]
MVILASESPRRRELMTRIAADFLAVAADVDETIAPGTHPEQAVKDLALRKAMALRPDYPDTAIIGADTVVALDDVILGKPRDTAHAGEMLRALSGRRHLVYTGVAIVKHNKVINYAVSTAVWFRPLDEAEITAYVDSGEPMDKAGAYGIQGKGGLFVSKIEGDYYNVVGFPICAIAQSLKELDETDSPNAASTGQNRDSD